MAERESDKHGPYGSPSVRIRLRGLTVVLSLAALLLGHHAAFAQDAATQRAKNFFDDGQNLYLQGKYLEAAKLFTKAYDTKPFPAFIFNIAVCYEKNEDYQKALQQYERFLAADPHSRDNDLVKERIEAMRTYLNPPAPSTQPTSQPVKPKLAKLPPVRTKGLVVIESAPEGAAIYLGDKKAGVFTRTPYTGSLPPGQHTVLLELKEFKPVRKTVLLRHDRLTYLYFALTPQRNLGWIEIKGNIPGAGVYLDKRSFGTVGRTPYSGHLRPGPRKVIVEREGYDPFEREITIVAGKTHVIDFRLERVRHGWIMVSGQTTRGATVTVDGKPLTCMSYPCRGTVAPGEHTVVVERDGYKSYETTVNVARAQEVRARVRLNPKPSRLKSYISFGMAAMLLGGGIAAGVISQDRKNSLEDDISSGVLVDSGDSRYSEGKIAAIVANSLFAVSGVAAILGVYYLFRKVGPDSRGDSVMRNVAISPIIGPNGAALRGEVRF